MCMCKCVHKLNKLLYKQTGRILTALKLNSEVPPDFMMIPVFFFIFCNYPSSSHSYQPWLLLDSSSMCLFNVLVIYGSRICHSNFAYLHMGF